MKRALKILSALIAVGLFLGIFIIALGVSMAIREFEKSGPLQESLIIEIPRGAHVGGIADKLSDENVIESWIIFKYMARFTGQHTAIKAGEYEFPPHISMKDVLQKLVEGETYQRQFTIREGLTSYEIEQLLLQIKDIEIVPLEPFAEGSLLPETYSYTSGESILDLARRMGKAMSDVKLELCAQEPCWDKPLTSWADVINLAAIVEKETAVASERKRVAGVFMNRLRKGMKLQTDPTVIYALTQGKPKNEGKGPLGRRLLRKDLKFDSPYNTYLYTGLPPAPIAHPGRASIEAVLSPEAHDYIYFVADGTGGHAFGKTLKEHNRNVAQWRKIRRAQEKK